MMQQFYKGKDLFDRVIDISNLHNNLLYKYSFSRTSNWKAGIGHDNLLYKYLFSRVNN